MQRAFFTAIVALVLAVFGTLQAAAETSDASHPAARAIIDFNHSITNQDIDTAIALLAEGSIQYQLHPTHPGMPEDQPLTADLPALWKTVAAVLSATTEGYERQVEIIDVHASGELAIVWTQTKTITNLKDKDEPMVLEFTEMYFLVNKNDTGWLIAGTASNRPVDDIPIG
jgi:ketosteroid isomerase-like protein